MRGYFPLIRKAYVTVLHGLVDYVKQGLSFAQDVVPENYRSPSFSLSTVIDTVSSYIDNFLSIDPSNVFVFRDFNFGHKDWLIYYAGTNRPD